MTFPMTSPKNLGRAAGLLSSLVLFTPMGAAHAVTITVSPGQSIQAAVDKAVAGDTVQVLAGTYSEKVLIANKSGTASAPIILKAAPNVVISGTDPITGKVLKPSGREGLITIRNANYLRVDGFELTSFTASGDTTPVGILVEGNASNLQLLNNKIHDIQNTSTCKDPCSTGAHGLAVFGTNTTGVTDLLVQGNEVYKNVLQSSESLVINGNVDRFEVLNNNVHDNNNIGFDFIGYEDDVCSACGENNRARNGIVRGNRSQNNSSKKNPWYGGQSSADGFYVDGGRNIIFDRNVSTGNDIGFEFASEHSGKATEDILMTNNFVYLNTQAGLSLGGYSTNAGQSRRITVNNNSFYKNKGWGSEITFQFKVTGASFGNNIFFGKGSTADDFDEEGSGNSGNVWGSNLWWGTDSDASDLPGTRVVADPRFVAPATGNLNLQANSPAINVGTVGAPLTGWTSPLFTRYYPSGSIPANGLADINGQARIENTLIDLGADEYGTSAATR